MLKFYAVFQPGIDKVRMRLEIEAKNSKKNEKVQKNGADRFGVDAHVQPAYQQSHQKGLHDKKQDYFTLHVDPFAGGPLDIFMKCIGRQNYSMFVIPPSL